MIRFYFYHHYFHIQFNYYSKNYLLLLVYYKSLLHIYKCIQLAIALFPFIQSKETSYIFNCGVVYFFFQSNEISCLFNCGVIYFVFVIKRLLISLIMLFSIYLSFSSVELSIIIRSEKKLINFFK